MSDAKSEKVKPTADYVFAVTGLLEKIFHDYNIKDLHRVARVCKSWNQVVKRELQHRGMQRLVLHEKFSNLDISNQLKVEPYIALLFIQQDYEAEDPREMTASARYIKEFPEMIMAVGAQRVYFEKHFLLETDKYDEEKSFGLFNPWEIPCLIIPKHEKCNVKYVTCSWEQVKNKSVNHTTIINKLMPKNKEAKTFFMLFGFYCTEILNKVQKGISQKYAKDKYVLWGSELYFLPSVNNCKNGVIDEENGISFLGISISSTNIDFFSTVFFCEDMKISEVYNDLVKFRDRVKLKKNNIALIIGPVFEDYYGSSDEEEMRVEYQEFRKQQDEFYTEDYEREYLYYFKKVFPDMPFISMFQDHMFRIFGNVRMHDLKKDDMDDAVSIVIITFA